MDFALKDEPSINIQFIKGEQHGVRFARVAGWTGFVATSAQESFDELLLRPEMEGPGVYVFIGEDYTQWNSKRLYIGTSKSVGKRLRTSAKVKKFWQSVIVVGTDDSCFSKDQREWLEGFLIYKAGKTQNIFLDNIMFPEYENIKLNPLDQPFLYTMCRVLHLILPAFGLSISIDKDKPQSLQEIQKKPTIDDAQFEMRWFRNAIAGALIFNGHFVVLAGSFALNIEKNLGYSSHSQFKELLIAEKVLVPIRETSEFLRFTADVGFRNASQAATVIRGKSRNGNQNWYCRSTGQNYGELYDSRPEQRLRRDTWFYTYG